MAHEALSILVALALLPGVLALAVAALAATFAYRGDSDIRALYLASDFRTLDPKVVRALRLAYRLDTIPNAPCWTPTLVDALPLGWALAHAPTQANATIPQGLRRKYMAA